MIFEWKKQGKGIFFGLLIVSFFYAWTGSAQAENMGPSITVVPHTFDLSVEKGEKINDRIKVYNRGDFAIPFKIRIVDFGAVEETGEMTMIDLSDSNSSAASWFEFEKQNFMVDPGQKEELGFSINVPEDAEPQGYYTMLMIEADVSTHLFNQSKVQVIPTMGVLFMLKIGGGEQANEPLTILEYSVLDEHRLEGAEKVANFLVKPFVSDSGHVNVIKSEQPTFLVKIKNNDPYHKKLSGNIKLSGVGWKLENELKVQPVTILPGMTRRILVKGATRENEQEDGQDKEEECLDKEGSFGFMQANLKIEEEQGFTKQQQQLIIVFSWKMVTLFLSAVVCITMLTWIVRKKRKKVKPKPKFKKRLPGIIGKTEEKTRGDVGIKATGEEILLSSHRKTRRKPANKKAKKSPKGGSSSGRKTTKKAVKETATKRTRKGSPRTKQQTRKTVTRKPARKKVLKGEDKKTSQRKTRRSSKTAKPRKRKTAKKRVAARKSPAKKSTRKRTRKSSPRTKQQTRKTATRKPIKKKTTPKKRAQTLKKRVKKVRSKARVSKSAASKKQKKKRIVRTKRAAKRTRAKSAKKNNARKNVQRAKKNRKITSSKKAKTSQKKRVKRK